MQARQAAADAVDADWFLRFGRRASKADACTWFRGLAQRFESKADPCMEEDPTFYETFYNRPH